MSAKFHSAGIIRLQPCFLDCLGEACDDSTLDLLLASLAQRGSLADAPSSRGPSARFTAIRRFTWPASAEVDILVRANVAQLTDELQTEFERLEEAAA